METGRLPRCGYRICSFRIFQGGNTLRFLVDLYRYLIFVICGAILILLTYGLVSGVASGVFNTTASILWGLGAVVVIVGLILSLGLVAVAISIHDRHAELVSELERIGDLIEYRGTTQVVDYDE